MTDTEHRRRRHGEHRLTYRLPVGVVPMTAEVGGWGTAVVRADPLPLTDHDLAAALVDVLRALAVPAGCSPRLLPCLDHERLRVTAHGTDVAELVLALRDVLAGRRADVASWATTVAERNAATATGAARQRLDLAVDRLQALGDEGGDREPDPPWGCTPPAAGSATTACCGQAAPHPTRPPKPTEEAR